MPASWLLTVTPFTADEAAHRMELALPRPAADAVMVDTAAGGGRIVFMRRLKRRHWICWYFDKGQGRHEHDDSGQHEKPALKHG